ncbi:MAG: putative UDP-N-acetylgalactosamine-undecaprenyl-phosphate N-acetylgalactosaminephosphotransferase, partial [Clostridia bacterium]|nr:putative UDP-N-acetylgalactosamine-undecaprenyl-phosphate N-acetylgalactosaminephosphotransferase [Clostridia bacterium]
MMEKVTDKRSQWDNYKVSFYNIMNRVIKKLVDVLFAFVGLIASIPIIFIAVILIKIETKGPIIYTQQRVGKKGRLFDIYKLRTMCFNAEKDGIQWAQKHDPRVTKVGRLLRKTRIDELPQLINVLKGDMSIVGPRPERPYFVEAFSKNIPSFYERLAVLPGITGWSQVHGGYELSPEEKLEKDLYYIKNQSI